MKGDKGKQPEISIAMVYLHDSRIQWDASWLRRLRQYVGPALLYSPTLNICSDMVLGDVTEL